MFDISLKTTIPRELAKLARQHKKKVRNPLREAGYELMKYAKGLVDEPYRGEPSPAGKPPRRRSGKLQRSIRYDVEGCNLFVGVLNKSKGWYGNLQEFGGTFTTRRKGKSKGKRQGRKTTLPARPFMRPTFENNYRKVPLKFKDYMTKNAA